MHLFHIPQCSIRNRNVHISVHISVPNGALWDMEQVYSGICEIGLLQYGTLHLSKGLHGWGGDIGGSKNLALPFQSNPSLIIRNAIGPFY